MQSVLVFAGNHAQYRDFVNAKGLDPRQFTYVNSARDLMGRRGAHYIRIGEWWRGPAWDEAADYLAEGGFIEDQPPA